MQVEQSLRPPARPQPPRELGGHLVQVRAVQLQKLHLLLRRPAGSRSCGSTCVGRAGAPSPDIIRVGQS